MGAYALLVGISKFDDPKLGKLTAPKEDVESLAAVLRDPNRGCFDQVETSIDSDVQTLREQMVSLLADRRPRDLVVLYYSGHGILAKGQRLYLATGRSVFDRPQASSLPAREIRDLLEQCRAERQVVILDCCHSGAFSDGAKGVATAVTEETFGTAEGQYVLTATDAQQFAYDTSGSLQGGEDAAGLSRFTSWLVDGIKGEASTREEITLDDVFDYVQKRARKAAAGMTPKLLVRGKSGELVIAKNPSVRATTLSDDLVNRLDSPDWRLRKAAVEELVLLSKESRLARLVKNAVVDRISRERDVDVREAMEELLAQIRGARSPDARAPTASLDIPDTGQRKPAAPPVEPTLDAPPQVSTFHVQDIPYTDQEKPSATQSEPVPPPRPNREAPAMSAKTQRPKRVKTDTPSPRAVASDKPSPNAPPDAAPPAFISNWQPPPRKTEPDVSGANASAPVPPRLLSHAYEQWKAKQEAPEANASAPGAGGVHPQAAPPDITISPRLHRTDATPTLWAKVRWILEQQPAWFVALVLPPLLFATWQLFRVPMPSYNGPKLVFIAASAAFLAALVMNRAAAILIAGLVGVAFALKPALIPMRATYDHDFPFWSETAMQYWVPGMVSLLIAIVVAFTVTRPLLLSSFARLRPGIAALLIAVATSGASYAYFSRPTYYDVYAPLLPQYAAFREHLKSVAAAVDKVTGPVQPAGTLDPPLVLDERNTDFGADFNEVPSTTGHLFFYPLLREPSGRTSKIEEALRSDLFWYILYTDPSIFFPSNGTGFVSNADKVSASLSLGINAPYLVVVKPLGGTDDNIAGPYRVFLYDLKRDQILFAADVADSAKTSDLKEQVNTLLEKAVGAKILRPGSGVS